MRSRCVPGPFSSSPSKKGLGTRLGPGIQPLMPRGQIVSGDLPLLMDGHRTTNIMMLLVQRCVPYLAMAIRYVGVNRTFYVFYVLTKEDGLAGKDSYVQVLHPLATVTYITSLTDITLT